MSASEEREEPARLLLILDLDETLVYAVGAPLAHECHLCVGPYYVYKRPHLDLFLHRMSRIFDLAVWSAGTAGYVEATVEEVFRGHAAPRFVWSRWRCTRRYDPEQLEDFFLKDLKKVERKGFCLKRVLIVEDDPQKVSRNYGNAVYVRRFCGDPEDTELLALSNYLERFADCANVRSVEKRGWRWQ